MTLDPSTTAVVLIEYQNEFTTEGGVLHGAVAKVMGETKMLGNTVEIAGVLRKKGVTIMHAPIMFAPGYNELTKHPYGILKASSTARRSSRPAGARRSAIRSSPPTATS
jgi:nicotinamidase-related amidase